jgi:hypothetical protein
MKNPKIVVKAAKAIKTPKKISEPKSPRLKMLTSAERIVLEPKDSP